MIDLTQAAAGFDYETHRAVVKALGVLTESGIFQILVRDGMNPLIAGRFDSEDEDALLKEIRDLRQTNRFLLGFEESALQFVKDNSNENLA